MGDSNSWCANNSRNVSSRMNTIPGDASMDYSNSMDTYNSKDRNNNEASNNEVASNSKEISNRSRSSYFRDINSNNI